MTRAQFPLGTDPDRPDPLRQVPVNEQTRPSPEEVARVERERRKFLERMNRLNTERSRQAQLYTADTP